MPNKIGESGLTLLQKVQFFVASGGRSIINGLVNSAFIKYYTDFIGLDPKWMGYVFILFTIWAAINDPIFGLWMDKRPYQKGIGKYRPAFVKSIPFWIVITLAFPWASPSWSQLAISIYLFVALTLWETASTVFTISYDAIAVNLFLTTRERAEVEVVDNYVGVLAVFGSSIPIMILSMDVSNQTMLLFFGIVTIVSGLIMAVSIPVVREDEGFYEHEILETFTIREFFTETWALLSERTFLIYFLTFLMFQRVASNYLIGLSYIYDNVILSEGFWTGLPDILIGILALIMYPIIAKWIRQFGTKLVLTRMIIVSLVGYVLLTFIPATQGDTLNMVSVLGVEIPGEKSYWIATLWYFLIYFGFAGVYTTNSPIQKRLIDFLEIKTGKRRPGTVKGVIGVLMTPGNAIYIFLFTQIISAFGYNGASKVQDLTSQWGIRLAVGLMPAVLILIGLFFFSKYPLDKELEDQIEAETLAKHRAG